MGAFLIPFVKEYRILRTIHNLLWLCYNLYMDYSKAIKALRDKLLLSQSEFAEKMGVSFATVNRWENNWHEPTYKAKRRIVGLCKKNKIDMGEK
jgi:DNA-binding XRE family transcriptional regulator